MKNLIIVLFFLEIITACNPNSSIEQLGDLKVLHLSGSPYERGLAYGQIMKSEIHIIIDRWITEVEKEIGDFDEVTRKLIDSTQLLYSIKKYYPELLEEVYGISEGAGIYYQTVLAFQLSEELDALFSGESQHCTSMSIDKTDTTPTILAQNMDPPLYFHGFPILLHITETKTELEQFIYTVPGFIGLTGMNSKGVAVTCNGISMLNSSANGLPVSFIVRLILNQENERMAKNILNEIPIATPQCFTIGGVSGAVCYETSANEVKVFIPFKNSTITLHTNFSILNSDFNQKFINILKEYGKTVDDPYYCPRYFLAYDKIVEVDYLLNAEKIKDILSLTEPTIEPISNKNTYGCLIMKLTDNPVLYIAPGKPDETEFIQLNFNYFSR
jgi:predicted choloylglycine hydrolase